MSANILIIAAGLKQDKFLSSGRAEIVSPGFGELFETALIEVVRTLEGPSNVRAVLVPWTTETAALIAAASADAAPSFDPESRELGRGHGARLITYRYPGREDPHGQDPNRTRERFWHASHFALGIEAPLPFAEAIAQYPPTHVIALGLPADLGPVQEATLGSNVQLLTFGSLLRAGGLASALNVPREQVRDLEADRPDEEDGRPEGEDGTSLEREWEAGLEPYVPYGLLLQTALDELLLAG